MLNAENLGGADIRVFLEFKKSKVIKNCIFDRNELENNIVHCCTKLLL